MLKKILSKLAFVAIGALAGYAYYHFVGCTSGTCPITSSPVISTICGALFGFLIPMIFAKPGKKNKE